MSGTGQNDKDLSLSDKIEELESLLDQQESEPTDELESSAIPVLDELVTEDDYGDAEEPLRENSVESAEDIEDLARKLEEKLTSELDQFVHLLKGKLKNSIIEELRSELREHPETQEEYDHKRSQDNELPE